MAQLSNQQVQALGVAVGLNISEPELTEVAHSLNAILESIAEIDLLNLNLVEPLPLLIPEEEG
ncbi:MAG: hypothetical protein IIB31_08865 [Chloroflexi bacterium]|nr:hypothetical protein [Chloroflexota bacterium]